MVQERTVQKKFNELRGQAEKLLAEKGGNQDSIFTESPLRLLHELETLTVELELQNEDLKRTQLDLETEREKYVDLYDFAPVGYLTLSKKGLILKVNLTFTAMMRLGRRYFINQPLSAYIIFQDQNIYYRHLREVSDSKRQQICELRMKKKDGASFDAQLESIIIADKYSGTQQYRVVVFDITRRKQTEKALKESEEKYRILVENANDAIFVAQDGVIKFSNQINEKLTGYSTEELSKLLFADLIHPDDKMSVLENYRSQIAGEQKLSAYSYRLINKSGEVQIVQVNTAMIQWENKAATLNVLRDITQQRKLDLRLQQAQRLETIGVLAGGIAHDFNNILTPIMGFAEMSLGDLPEDHPTKENLEDILQGAKRARDLVKQILAFSHEKEIRFKVLNLQPLVKEALKLLRSTIPSNIEIIQELNEDENYILGNTIEIHEIVMNLCINAYHSMEEKGGTISVVLKKAEPDPGLALPFMEYCCLIISDTGMGISPDIIDRIYDPYFTTKEFGKGSGLGLAVVHGIVKKYKGEILVESEPGIGSTFSVYLPLSRKIQKIESGLDDPNYPKGDENILFVDDEKIIVKLGVQILERLGYKATGKTCSIDALELFQSDPSQFDLVMTDMAMPNMVGTKFAEKLIRIRPDIPIIICTGFSEQMDFETARSLGILDYLKKPILISELSSKVRKVLDQAKKR